MATESLSQVKRRPKQVDFFDRQDDHNCALFGALGMSTAFIMEKTGLSQCQVTYRLKKAGLTKDNKASRLDFRNGVSPFSVTVLRVAEQVSDAQLIKFLKKNL